MQIKALSKRYFSSINTIIRVSISLALVVLFVSFETDRIPVQFFKQLELQTYDTRLRLTLPNTVDPRVVIIDIDEKSLVAEGHWPWSRDKLAELVKKLFDRSKVKVLGLDIVFSEADDSSGLKTLEQLGKGQFAGSPDYQNALVGLRKDLDYDGKFAEVLKNYPVIMGFSASGNLEASEQLAIGQLPAPIFTTDTFGKRSINTINISGYSANLKTLQDAAAGGGHFLPAQDVDGVIRRVPMLVKYKDGLYEALALALYRTYLDNAPFKAEFPSASDDPNGTFGLSRIVVGNTRIPLDDATTALVPYRGESPKFRYISATDILRDALPEGELAGKIALLGTSAQGLVDLRSSPVGAFYPGVEVHANLISGFLDNSIKARSENDAMIGTFIMMMAGLLLAFLLPRLSAVYATVVSVGLLIAVLGFNLFEWQYRNTVFNLALPLLMIVVLYVFNMAYGFFAESRSKRAIVSRFGEYVPKELVSEMAKNPSDYSMKGESRDMTVLFSDVRDFTSISEKLPPDQLSLMMNNYLTPMTEVIQKQRGTIDKYIGDAIMAFWGAPVADAEHAKHGLIAAMEMQRTLTGLGPEFQKRGWPILHIGVGLNCGKMNVGNMGSAFRRAYTVMGDAVNLAARLEGLTKQYGVGILVSENIVQAVPAVVYRELDRVRVKGKLEPISIYEPIGIGGEVVEQQLDETDRFHKALQRFRAQQWDEAERLIRTLLYSSPDAKVYKIYLERIAFYRENPPGAGWDGVFTHTEK